MKKFLGNFLKTGIRANATLGDIFVLLGEYISREKKLPHLIVIFVISPLSLPLVAYDEDANRVIKIQHDILK